MHTHGAAGVSLTQWMSLLVANEHGTAHQPTIAWRDCWVATQPASVGGLHKSAVPQQQMAEAAQLLSQHKGHFCTGASRSSRQFTHRYHTAAPGAPLKELKSSCDEYSVRLRQSLQAAARSLQNSC